MTVLRPAGDFDRSYAQDVALIRQPWQWVLLAGFLIFLFTLPSWARVTILAVGNQMIYTLIAV